MKIKITQLESLTKKALKKYGYTPKEIKVIKDVLLYAQLRGNNQGIVKLVGKGLPKNPEATEIEILKETKLSALLNGNKNMGMVVMKAAMEKAVKKAKRYGFGMVGMNNTNTSTGAIGYFANEIAKLGYLGFVFAGSPETVNTHGSYEPIFGTNPFAIGIPTTNDPVVLDMATAYMAYFGLVEAKIAGKNIPEGIAYDSEGNLTTDPAKAMDGAIRPFDRNYKGAGLAMMVEILTGPLVRATFTGIGDTSNWGNLIFVIDPELLTDKTEFANQVSQLVQKVKSTKRLPEVDEIFVPGERGNKLAKRHLESGEIEVEDNLLRQLKEFVKN
ncbi:Ldh family oxidoreductase [Patescibacteria group bacterium]|nr:Ldh family oxidoreductase [Patescibacteria group bacterium]